MARKFGSFSYEVMDTEAPKYVRATSNYRKLWEALGDMPTGTWKKVRVTGSDGLTGEALEGDLRRKKDRIRASIGGFDLRYLRKKGLHINTHYSSPALDAENGYGDVYFIKLPEGEQAADYLDVS